MIELSGVDVLIPVVVSALVVALRNFAGTLDGPKAYWWVLGMNVVAQVATALVADGPTAATVANAAALGVGTGATVSVGLATAGKRVGLSKLVTPPREGA